MNKEINILKIIKEDVLRIIAENRTKVTFSILKEKIIASSSCIEKAITELKKEELIRSQKDFFELTDKGARKAKDILKKHLSYEQYFKNTRSEKEAHEMAHILEHYVSEEVIHNIKKLTTLKEKGTSLTDFKLDKKGLITDIMTSDNGLFERMVSMGILPGENIIVTNIVLNTMIVKLKSKKFALNKNIAKNIKVIEHEKS